MANVQVTISGIDKNGFVWQNVFYMLVAEGSHATNVVLHHACEWANDQLMDTLQAAMSFQNSIFDIAAKYVKPDSSYTIHKSLNLVGARESNADSGAIGGVIQWIPQDGPETGRQYITGVCVNDYQNDFIVDVYRGFLEDIIVAFMSLTGNDGLFDWIFVVYSKGDNVTPATTDPVVEGTVIGKAGVLSKRTRA